MDSKAPRKKKAGVVAQVDGVVGVGGQGTFVLLLRLVILLADGV